MAFNKAEKSDFPRKKGGMRRRKKVCVFCGEKNGYRQVKEICI